MQKMCDKQFCNRPASLAAALSFCNARFCSLEHRDQGVRLNQREITRLEGLLNKILLLNARSLHGYRTFRSEQTTSGLLVLHQEEYERPLALFSPAVDHRIEEIGFCYDSCVHALQMLAGVLSYFVEGFFTVEEAHLRNAKASQHMLFLEHTTDDRGEPHMNMRGLAQWHGMFKLFSPFGEVYLDPTAPQYGRPQGWRDCGEYLRDYHSVPLQLRKCLGSKHDRFGRAYKELQGQLNASQERHSAEALNMVMCRTATRHINNVVHKAVEQAGGSQTLRLVDDETWTKIQDRILEGVGDWMETLHADIDQVTYRFSNDARRSDTYWAMLHQSQGAGNETLVEYLSRAYGEDLPP